MPAAGKLSTAQWELPPLILHPFADRSSTQLVAGASIAAELEPVPDQDLSQRLVQARYLEFRMLCFIGKDIARWMEQCMDFVARTEALGGRGLREQSFADLLVEHPPASVDAKLRTWGISDYRPIFIRAIGLQSIFPHAPEQEIVSESFLRHYQRYAEYLYTCRRQLETYNQLDPAMFRFELFSSGEYSRLLERQWSA